MRNAGRVCFLLLMTAGLAVCAGCKPGVPMAGFTAEPRSGTAPVHVHFTDASRIDKDSSITGWAWTFGDGGTSADQNPAHTYAAAGTYEVSLTVTGNKGGTNTATLAGFITVTPARVTVPNVAGMTQAAATAALTGAGLAAGAVTQQTSATVPAGSVISQNPAAGTQADAGSAVALVVSSGPQMAAVPDGTGITQADAEAALTGAGLVLGTVTTQFSDTVPAGSVISQNPAAGGQAAIGSAVDLVVSAGPAITTPNVVGLAQADAQTLAGTAGFGMVRVELETSATVLRDHVISQNPAAGVQVAAGSEISLTVSSGYRISILLPGDVSLELTLVHAGSFTMGSPDTERNRDASEGPQHTVTLADDFYLGTCEVTQAQWTALMGGPPSAGYGDNRVGDSYPVYNVTWAEAQGFVAALNSYIPATGQGPLTVRLPSEAEWEYACRGGTQTRFFFGDSLDVGDANEDDGVRGLYMWYAGNNVGPYALQQKPVGIRLFNPFGLFDTHGNVSEWCADAWHADYTGAPSDGSVWDEVSPAFRVFRGGWWGYDARFCRSASRFGGSAYGTGLGFRVAATQ